MESPIFWIKTCIKPIKSAPTRAKETVQ